MQKKFNLVQKKNQFSAKKIQFIAKKIKISAKRIQNSAEKIQDNAAKIQKVTNRVNWIFRKWVSNMITMFIDFTKIQERKGSISPSSFYGQRSNY